MLDYTPKNSSGAYFLCSPTVMISGHKDQKPQELEVMYYRVHITNPRVLVCLLVLQGQNHEFEIHDTMCTVFVI